MIPLGVLASARVASGVNDTTFGTGTPTVTEGSGTFNVGVIIQVSVAGNITALRYWEPTNGAGSCDLRLYVDGTTTEVRSVTDTQVATRTGWREVAITPYAVTAGQKVMAAVNTGATTARYVTSSGFLTSAVSGSGGFCTALASGSVGTWNGITNGNGRYISGSRTAIPTDTFSSSCYFADIVLTH